MHHDIQPLKVSVEKEKKHLSDPIEITEQIKYHKYQSYGLLHISIKRDILLLFLKDISLRWG